MDTPVRTRIACALLAAATPPLAHGQSPAPTEPTQLEEIIVRSGPFERTSHELVQPVDVLSGDELERRRRGTVGDVLADRPGISNASFGPGVGRPVIRGQSGPRVLLLENGIASMDASSISADHAVTIDPLDADQIEVIKGPATLIYGGGASAGIVNVIDDRLPDIVTPGLGLRGNLSYGDNGDERNGTLRARYGTGSLQLGADYARREAGEFEIPGYATRAGADEHEHDHGDGHAHEEEEERYGVLDNSDLETESFGASAAWVGDRGMLGVAVSRFESNYGIPGHGHAHEEEEGEEEGHSHDGVRIDMEQTRTDLRGRLYDPLPGFDRLELRAGINDYQHQEVEPSGAVGTTFDVQELEGRAELAHRPLGPWTGVAGLHFSRRDFEAVGAEAFVPPVITRGLGLFLVESREIASHVFDIGVRVDQVEHEPQPGDLPDTDFTPVSLSTGINIQLVEHLHLRVNLQRAQRAPAAEELYAFGPHLATLAFERGDADLDVETANNLDLSLSRDEGRWTWEISAFYNRINDYVFLHEVDEGLNADGSGTPSSDGVADRVSESGDFDADGELLLIDIAQQDAEFYGAETWLRFQLIEDGPLKLGLRGFGDIVRGQLKSGGQNLPRISPSRLGISADAEFGDLSAALGYTRVFEQDRLAPLETNTPGHDLVSADLEYALPFQNVKTTIYLQGRNLLDEKQRLSTSFLKDVAPQPGRSMFVGVRFDFLSPV
ncbi:MAG: TonB-dependent receptor [Sinimarinibacterium flocculans]|uniref:TonB-dependent receptor n=1 Tax=Sinimarinibacterium flocculans TaxID=985250 RepID=UPI003C5A9EA8